MSATSILSVGADLLQLKGGVSDLEMRRIQPVDGICFVDEAGYIGINAKDKFLYGSYTYACTYAAVCKGCDFSGAGLGKVTFFTGFDYGTLSFGGFDYRTIRIGDQEWMCDNLRYEVDGSYIKDDAYLGKFGRVYNKSAAKSVAGLVEGWHLPTKEDFEILGNAVGGLDVAGVRLRDSTFGGGTNLYGFSMLSSGFCGNSGTSWYDVANSNGGELWSNTNLPASNYTYVAHFLPNNSKMLIRSQGDFISLSEICFAVRLVKDS